MPFGHKLFVMIKNYFKIAWRNLGKYKFISFINVAGLTVGLTCCLLIFLYVLNELSYDKFNTKADQIYRVTRSFYANNGVENLHLSAVAPPFGPLLQNEFPDIEKITRLLANGITPMSNGDKLFNEKNVYWADSNVFAFFPVPVLKGNNITALNEPYSVMLTPEIARKYFGNEDPMNKMIKLGAKFNFKVTGIFQPFPSNTHLHPQIMLSFASLNDSALYGRNQLATSFGNNAFYTYLMLPKNYPVANIEKQFPAFIDKYVKFPGQPPSLKQSKYTRLYLQKLTDIHLRSHLDDEAEENGDINRVYIFSAIAFFILLIACINYMNLSTARSVLRAKEIGVRKVVGAQRKEIMLQFLTESVLITYIALLFALLLIWLLLPLVNNLSGQQLAYGSLMRWYILMPIVLLPMFVGLISGIYPALLMSSFKPVTVLKGAFKIGKTNFSFRQVLVVLQFAISIILIIATIIVFQQLSYIQNAALGFDREHIITMPYNTNLTDNYEAFRNSLLQSSGVKEVGRSSRIPTGRLLDDMGAQVISGDSLVPTNADLKLVATDYNFIPTYGIQLAAGRNFSKDFGTDTSNYIINETAVQMLGWKNAHNAIGKDLNYGGTRGKIIGVMKDFHFESMHQEIIPMILLLPSPSNSSYFGNISIKISSNNIASSVNYIQQKWKQYFPQVPFSFTFLDENFANLYKSEQEQGKLFTIFSFIAIFIACLGLFGLSAFTITQRVKEIGIRKVLGASVSEIVKVISKDFLKLVAVAALIAFPIAWFSMHRWLQDFAYRININWWVFAVAGLAALCIALLTISVQAIKAALANPVKSLRTE